MWLHSGTLREGGNALSWCYMDHDKHTVRLALMLTAVVAVLVFVAIDRFTGTGTQEQQAAVLRADAE